MAVQEGKSQNLGMVWVGWDLRDHLVSKKPPHYGQGQEFSITTMELVGHKEG